MAQQGLNSDFQNQPANTGLQNQQPLNLNKSQSQQPFQQSQNYYNPQANYNQAYQIPASNLNYSSNTAEPYQIPQNQQSQNQQNSQQYIYQLSQIVPNSIQSQTQSTQRIPQVNVQGYQQEVQNAGIPNTQYTYQNQSTQNNFTPYLAGSQFTLQAQNIPQQTQKIPQIVNQLNVQNPQYNNIVSVKPGLFDVNQSQNTTYVPQMSNQQGFQQDSKPQLQGQNMFQIQKDQANTQPFSSNTMQSNLFIPQASQSIQQQQGIQNQPQSQSAQYNFNKSQSGIQIVQQQQQNTSKINEFNGLQNFQGQNAGFQSSNFQPQQQVQQNFSAIPQQINQYNTPNPSFQYQQSDYNVPQDQKQTSFVQPQTNQINNPQQGQEIQIKGLQQQPNQVQNTGNQSTNQVQYTQAMKQFFDQNITSIRKELDQKLMQFKKDLQQINIGSNQNQRKENIKTSLDQTIKNIKQKLNDYIKEIGKDEDIIRIVALNIYNQSYDSLKPKLKQLQDLQRELSSQKYQKYIAECNQLDIQAKILDAQLPKNATMAAKNTTVQLKIFFQNKSLIQLQGDVIGIQVSNYQQKVLHKIVKSGETVNIDYSLEIPQQIGQTQFQIQLVNLKNNKILDTYLKAIEVIQMPQIQITEFKQMEYIGKSLQGGQQIKLQWKIVNSGLLKWPEGVVLISEQSHLTNFQEQKIFQLERNQFMFIPIDLKVPENPGKYDLSWDFQWQEQSLGEKLKFNFQIQEGKIPLAIIQKHQLTQEQQQIMLNCLDMVGQYDMDKLAHKVKLYKEDQLISELFKGEA